MGSVNIFHSRRTNFQECKYWVREEDEKIGDASQWILKKTPAGTFWAKEISPRLNQMNQLAGVFAFDKDTITLESSDDLSDIAQGCIVLYNGKVWFVKDVQCRVFNKETQFSSEITYKYYINIRR